MQTNYTTWSDRFRKAFRRFAVLTGWGHPRDNAARIGLAEQLAGLQKLKVDRVLSDHELQEIKTRLVEKQAAVAPEARSEQVPGTPEHNNQDQPSADVALIVDPYRVFKAIALNVLIVCAFGFTGAIIVATVFHFRLRSSAVIAPLALADALSYALGFTLVGIRSPGAQYWRHLFYVAGLAWLASILLVTLFGLTITSWVFSGIWIALAAAMGGGIGFQLRRASKVREPDDKIPKGWDWRETSPQNLLAVATCAVAIIILGISLVAYDDGPIPPTTYSGLMLRMTIQEVKSVKGDPSGVGVSENVSDEDLTQGGTPSYDLLTRSALLLFDARNLPHGRHVEDYQAWAYYGDNKNATLRVDFDPKTKKLIGITCITTRYSDISPFGLSVCPDLLGVEDRMSESDITRKLGNPTERNIDHAVTVLGYKDRGVQFFLTNGHVFMLNLFATQ